MVETSQKERQDEQPRSSRVRRSLASEFEAAAHRTGEHEKHVLDHVSTSLNQGYVSIPDDLLPCTVKVTGGGIRTNFSTKWLLCCREASSLLAKDQDRHPKRLSGPIVVRQIFSIIRRLQSKCTRMWDTQN